MIYGWEDIMFLLYELISVYPTDNEKAFLDIENSQLYSNLDLNQIINN